MDVDMRSVLPNSKRGALHVLFTMISKVRYYYFGSGGPERGRNQPRGAQLVAGMGSFQTWLPPL